MVRVSCRLEFVYRVAGELLCLRIGGSGLLEGEGVHAAVGRRGRGAHEHAVHSDGGADGAGRPGGVDAHARPAIRSDGIQQAALWRDAGPDVRGGGCWVDRMRVQETRQRWSADEFSSSSAVESSRASIAGHPTCRERMGCPSCRTNSCVEPWPTQVHALYDEHLDGCAAEGAHDASGRLQPLRTRPAHALIATGHVDDAVLGRGRKQGV
jgi:hypothetical protein